MSNNPVVLVEYDEDGNAIIPLPKDMIDQLWWNEKTILTVHVDERGVITLRRKTDWTVDQLQDGDNLDMVIDDIAQNGSVHCILDKGKTFVMAPYSDDLEKLKNEFTK